MHIKINKRDLGSWDRTHSRLFLPGEVHAVPSKYMDGALAEQFLLKGTAVEVEPPEPDETTTPGPDETKPDGPREIKPEPKTVRELRVWLKARGITAPFGAKKAHLVALYESQR